MCVNKFYSFGLVFITLKFYAIIELLTAVHNKLSLHLINY